MTRRSARGKDKNPADPTGHKAFVNDMAALEALKKKKAEDLSEEEKDRLKAAEIQAKLDEAGGSVEEPAASGSGMPSKNAKGDDGAGNKKRVRHDISDSEDEVDEALVEQIVREELLRAKRLKRGETVEETEEADGSESEQEDEEEPETPGLASVDDLISQAIGPAKPASPTVDAAAQSDLEFVSQFFPKKADKGPPLPEALLNIVLAGLQQDMPTAEHKALMEKYLVPENCELLNVPRINQPIWEGLDHDPKQRDIAMITVQGYLQKAIVPLMDAMKMAIDKRDATLCAPISDAFKLVALATRQLSFKRRLLVQPDINPKYKPLCSATFIPVTTKLFGDDVAKAISDVDSMAKITAAVTKKSFKKHKPSFKPKVDRSNIRNRVSFLRKGKGGKKFPVKSSGGKGAEPANKNQ